MAFTYDITTNRGKVRFLLGDTVSTSSYFTDDEIDYLLSKNSSDIDASAMEGALQLSLQFARTPNKKIGDLSLTYQDISNSFLKIYNALKSKSSSTCTAFAGGISSSDKDDRYEDSDRVDSFFTRDQFDILPSNTDGYS
jgi:hypothetical protein